MSKQKPTRVPKRDRRLDLRLSGKDAERLDKIVAYWEVSASEAIRRLIKERVELWQSEIDE